MGESGKTIHIRLPPRLLRRLEDFHAEQYAGLPVATVAKLLLADQLLKDPDALAAIVQEQLRTPPEGPVPERLTRRIGSNNRGRGR